jgi:hypothetical protein
MPPNWRYLGSAAPIRLAALADPLPHSKLADALRIGFMVDCFHREPRHDDNGYRRAVFCGTVSSQLFDWFFNASTGYRGAFFRSADNGTKANHQLIAHLTPILAEWTVLNRADADPDWVQMSLAKRSAKMWLAEYPGLCDKCIGEWTSSCNSDLLIENSRWEYSSHVHAQWGRQAPLFSKIRVFGGFIDARRNEWLAAHTEDRAEQIWEHGWS